MPTLHMYGPWVIVLVFTLAVTAANTGCKYEFQVPAENCPTNYIELDNKLSHVESQQHMDEERQAAIANSFKEELIHLENEKEAIKTGLNRVTKDGEAVKTVLTSLVEDNVKIQGNLRLLRDLGADVRDNRNQARAATIDMSNKLDQVQQALSAISTDSQRQISAIKEKMTEQDSKINALQAQVDSVKTQTSSTTDNNLEEKIAQAVNEKLAPIQQAIDGLNDRLDG